MKRAVKYCGGCRAAYDRRACVRQLEEKLGQSLSPAEPGAEYDELYVVCGCTARCADIAAIRAGKIIMIDGPGQEFEIKNN